MLNIEENETTLTYQWTKFNPETEVWEHDPLNTNPIEIDGVEHPLIDGKVEIIKQIPPPPSLSDIQQQKILELNTACNQTIMNGFPSSCTGLEHQYKFDEEYQGNFSKKMGLLALVPTIQTVYWPTKDAGVVEHTREQFIQLAIDGQTHMETKIFRYFGMKAQVEACAEIADVETFVW